MPGPASATGEDCAEIHTVGNPFVLERIIAAIIAHSDGTARRAHPGEFSVRAVLSGRMPIAAAERVAAVIMAETDGQLTAASMLQANTAEQSSARDADEIATLLALVEAGIDFTDQDDVVAIARPVLEDRVRSVRDRIRARCATSAGAESAQRATRVVLTGAPNAGKSSLFNALLQHTRVVESSHRGTTRDAIEHACLLPDGVEVILVDAPGIDDAVHDVDVLMQARAHDAMNRADIILVCHPSSHDQATNAHQSPLIHRAHGVIIHVRTKCDALGTTSTTDTADVISTSAHTGVGIAELRAAIARTVSTRAPHHAHEFTLGVARVALLQEAADSLDHMLTIEAPELVAAALRTALDRLGEVSGAIPPDDVLGRLFSSFCIGK
jgi:tRNA modification GTPase